MAVFLPPGRRSVNVHCRNGRRETRHLRVNERITRESFSASDVKRLAAKIAQHSACFGDDQTCRANIPRFQFHFPVAIDAAASDITQIEGCGTVTANALAAG